MPELWIQSGISRADYQINIYTIVNGNAKLMHTGGFSIYGCYRGNGYIISEYGQMGYTIRHKYIYNGTRIIEKEIFSGEDEKCTELKEPHITTYNYNDYSPIYRNIK